MKPASPRWPWLMLALAMIWVALVRIPLIRSAHAHLDSDLAVDGLTLLDATRGHFRWHYPGTPHMGIPSLFLAYPQAMVSGATAETITSGGVVAYELAVLAIFLLSWRAFGPSVAAWGLVPLAFASVGTVWLSGRLTGGHLLTVAWHAGALAVLHSCLARGGIGRAAVLGVWLGFGFYLDQMFLTSIGAIVLGAILFGTTFGAWVRKFLIVLAFAAGFVLGDLPRELGYRADPHDAYKGQFATILDPASSGPNEGRIDWARAGSWPRGTRTFFSANACLACSPATRSPRWNPTRIPPRSPGTGRTCPARPSRPG